MKFQLYKAFIDYPLYDDKVIQRLLTDGSVLGYQENRGDTMKFFSTDRTLKDTDVSGVYALKLEDRDKKFHYLVISVLDLTEYEEYKGCAQAYLFTFVTEIKVKDVRVIDEYYVDIQETAIGSFKDRIVENTKGIRY